jgi:hypothetical protein
LGKKWDPINEKLIDFFCFTPIEKDKNKNQKYFHLFLCDEENNSFLKNKKVEFSQENMRFFAKGVVKLVIQYFHLNFLFIFHIELRVGHLDIQRRKSILKIHP